MRRGDIWLAQVNKLRPVLILTRDPIAGRIDRPIVAPVTSTDRRIVSHFPLGRRHGLDRESWANLDAASPVARTAFIRHLGALDDDDLTELGEALAWTLGC